MIHRATTPGPPSQPHRAPVILTAFDRQVMAALVAGGGWNARTRSMLVSLARQHHITVDGLIKVVHGLNEYGRNGGPRLSAASIGGAEAPPTPRAGAGVPASVVTVEPGSPRTAQSRGIPLAALAALLATLLLLLGVLVIGPWLGAGQSGSRGATPGPPAAAPEPPPPPSADVAPLMESSAPALERFDTWPTFAVDVRLTAVEQARARAARLEADLIALAGAIAPDSHAGESAAREWRALMDAAGEVWVLLDDAALDSLRHAAATCLRAGGPAPHDHPLRQGMAPAPELVRQPVDVWRGSWGAGLMAQAEAPTDLSGASAAAADDPFAAEAGAWLDRATSRLVAMTAEGEQSLPCWELWLAAQRRVRADLELDLGLLHAARSLLAFVVEHPSDQADHGSRVPIQVLGRLLLSLDLQRSPVLRQRLQEMFDDEQIPAAHLALLTGILAAGDVLPWFEERFILAADADMRQRRRTWIAIAAAWPAPAPIDGEAAPPGAPPQAPTLTIDPVLRRRWETLVSRWPAADQTVHDAGLLGHLLTACWFNQAAAQLAAGQDAVAEPILIRIESATAAISSGEDHPALSPAGQPTVGQPLGHDGLWATAYQDLGQDTDARLRHIDGLLRAAGTDLGTVDAKVLVREMYRGRTAEIRARAAAVISARLSQGRAVVMQMLDQLSGTAATGSLSETIGRITGRALPSNRSSTWPREARLALVQHALGLHTSPASVIDRATEAVTATVSSEAAALRRQDAPPAPAADPAEAADWCIQEWRRQATALVSAAPTPSSLPDLQQRDRIRRALGHGPLQQFVGQRVSCLELLAYVTVAEQPRARHAAVQILAQAAQARDRSENALRQALETERAMAQLWLLRMSDRTVAADAQRQLKVGARIMDALAAIISVVCAVTDGDRRPWASRLELLRPGAPLRYFELAEEVADAARTDADRELARQLFGLAAVLDPAVLGRSACLALADMEAVDLQRQRLTALANMLDESAGRSPALSRGADPWARPDPDAAMAVCEAISDLRQGAGQRAVSRLQRPGAMDLLNACDRALPGGVARFLEDCRRYKGDLQPRLTEGDLVDFLRLESALLAGGDRSWSAELLLTDGAPLIEVDPDRLEIMLNVEASKPFWRRGEWLARP